MKKLTALLTTALLAGSMLTGCATKYYYNDDKAISLTAEYMKEKYGKDIKDISTHHVGMNEHYVGVKFKLDESDSEESDEKTYEVRVYIEDDGKTHYVKCDNYMNTLFQPYLQEKIDVFLKENNFSSYNYFSAGERQISAGGLGYYMYNFENPDAGISLENFLDSYDLSFDIVLRLPRKEADIKDGADETFDFIKQKLEEYIDDDWIHLYVQFYENNEFEKGEIIGYKGINVYHNEGVTPYNEKDAYLNQKM